MRLLRSDVQAGVTYLVDRITRGPGRTSAADRKAAVKGRIEGRLTAYLDQVRYAPTSITDADVAALLASGHSDDELFELTVASALGAAVERAEAGLAAIAGAYQKVENSTSKSTGT